MRPCLPLPLLFLSPSYPLHSLHLAASPKRNGSGVSLNSAAQPDLRLRHHRLLPPTHTAVAMATAIAASAFLSPAFAGGRTLHRQRRAARPRRAAPIGLAVRCEQSDKQKRQPLSALVPREERFMFEGDELCGPDIWNKTWYPKAADHVTTEKTWYVVDATDKILGRLASTIAVHMRGKNEPTYTPSVDMGAFVVVVNAEKVAVSGKKRTQKLYRRHSGRPGGMKVETFDQLQKRIPERIVEHAVRGMLPKGRLGRRLFTHLKVYKGPEHPHEAQKPVPLPIRDKRIQKTD